MGPAAFESFQSTPAITGERARRSWPKSAQSRRFNPRPPLLASEPLGSGQTLCPTDVSIHARHYWRASQIYPAGQRRGGGVSIHARHYWRASHPDLGLCGWRQPVSIHARHYWRASLRGLNIFGHKVVFQSTPAITGERAAEHAHEQGPHLRFNPRPPLLASEPHAPLFDLASTHCFNPRPPLLASEPMYFSNTPSRTVVSIHARHYWRASQCHRIIRRYAGVVSIHARHYWRASLSSFADHPKRSGVSIHARHYWRASLLCYDD